MASLRVLRFKEQKYWIFRMTLWIQYIRVDISEQNAIMKLPEG